MPSWRVPQIACFHFDLMALGTTSPGCGESLHLATTRYATSGMQECRECAQGSFTDEPGMAGCTLCGAGTKAPFPRATSCQDCPAGPGKTSFLPFLFGGIREMGQTDVWSMLAAGCPTMLRGVLIVLSVTAPGQYMDERGASQCVAGTLSCLLFGRSKGTPCHIRLSLKSSGLRAYSWPPGKKCPLGQYAENVARVAVASSCGLLPPGSTNSTASKSSRDETQIVPVSPSFRR